MTEFDTLEVEIHMSKMEALRAGDINKYEDLNSLEIWN